MAVATNQTSLQPYFPTTIDMSALSHSELLSLSLLSNSSPPSLSSNDAVFSSTHFNESASSRRQTYSDHSRFHRHHRHRLRGGGGGGGGGFSLLKREKSELNSIVDFLKQYLEIQLRNSPKKRKRTKFGNEKKKKNISALLAVVRDGEARVHHDEENVDVGLVDLPALSMEEREREVRNSPKSRKRENVGAGVVVGVGDFSATSTNERKVQNSRKEEEKRQKEKVSVEIVNRNGVVVDLTALVTAEGEDNGGPYGEELRRRAVGKEKEEELLMMMSEMKGEWCSKRKKRRFVDACLLGDALPVGWKLIIALRRKSGRFFPYCHRYISPTGEHLASCKEVASYLQFCFGISETSLLRDARGESCINSVAGCALVDVSNSAVPDSCMAKEQWKEISDLGIDNLPEVHVSDLYECHPCNVSFHEKDRYLQHLMLIHRSTTRRYHFGSSVEDSLVQMADSSKLPCLDWLPNNTIISPMDALIVAAQCSVQEIGPRLPEIELSASNRDKHSEMFELEVAEFMTGNKSISCSSELEMEKRNEEVCTQSVMLNSCDKLRGMSSDCPGKTEEVKIIEKDRASSVASIPIYDEDNSISCLSELEMENRSGEIKFQSQNWNSCDNLSGVCSDCPNKTEVKNADGNDEAPSVFSIATCDKVSETLITNGDINDPRASSIGSGKGVDGDESSTKGLNPSVKVTAESVTDRNELGSAFNEFGIKKDCEQTSFVLAELSPLNNSGNILMADVETRKEVRTYSRRVSVNNADIGPMKLSAAKSVTDRINTCENDAFSAKNEGSAMQHKLDPEQAQVYDDMQLANVTGVCHASDCTEPQKEMNSSLPFDEASGKAGRYVCGRDQNIESETRTEYMELDDIGPYLHNSMNGGDSVSLLELSMDMNNSTRASVELHSSMEEFQSEFQLSMADQDMKLTCCVWCGIQFSHEIVDIELHPDSVGFMCPSCRNKISSQFNVLDSFDPNLF